MGYWGSHEYVRLSVSETVEEFCGWTPIRELISLAKPGRDQAFLAALFLTGSRTCEVLSLRKENFEVRPEEGAVIMRGVPLEKRYRKIEEIIKPDGSRGWRTEKLPKTRKPFPLVLREPLAPLLMDWVNGSKGLLFPSPYREGPLSRHWAYKLVRDLHDRSPLELLSLIHI